MLDWIRGAVGRGITSVKDLASSVVQGFQLIWSVLTGLGHVVGLRWNDMVTGARNLRNAIGSFAGAAYNYLKYIVTVRIPQTIAVLRREAAHAWDAFTDLVAREIRAARQWAEQLVRKLVADLAAIVVPPLRSAIARLAELYNSFQHVKDTVVKYLAHPEALAELLFLPLWRLIIRYAQSRAEAIVRYILTRSVKLILDSANGIEDLIARIF